MNETLKTIFARKSVRAFTEEPVSTETLETIIRAGMAAPSAVDKRPWEFIVVTDRQILKQLADVLPFARMTATAAAAVIVAGDIKKQFCGEDADYWIVDCSAATENILLAAESLGVGAVWAAVYPEDDRITAVSSILGIPSHIVPLNVIPVGMAGGREKPKDKWNPAQLHWNTW